MAWRSLVHYTDGSEKTITILGDRCWPQTAKQEGNKISKKFLCNVWKKGNERPNVGGVSIRCTNGAPSRKGRVVNGQMTEVSNERVRPSSKWMHRHFLFFSFPLLVFFFRQCLWVINVEAHATLQYRAANAKMIGTFGLGIIGGQTVTAIVNTTAAYQHIHHGLMMKLTTECNWNPSQTEEGATYRYKYYKHHICLQGRWPINPQRRRSKIYRKLYPVHICDTAVKYQQCCSVVPGTWHAFVWR